MDTTSNHGRGGKRLLSYSVRLLKATFKHWLEDKAPQFGSGSGLLHCVFPCAHGARAPSGFRAYLWQ